MKAPERQGPVTVEVLQQKLDFARSVAARQRRKADTARHILVLLERAHTAGDSATVARLIETWRVEVEKRAGQARGGWAAKQESSERKAPPAPRAGDDRKVASDG